LHQVSQDKDTCRHLNAEANKDVPTVELKVNFLKVADIKKIIALEFVRTKLKFLK
jgi:hypothetical protein